jgi:hypothetical protein
MTNAESGNKPLWLSMEGMINDLADQDLAAGSKEDSIQRLASGLDDAGYSVSSHAGHLLELRAAVEERIAAGHSLIQDFDGAMAALTIADVENTKVAAAKLAVEVGAAFPLLKGLERRQDILDRVEQTRLDLHIAKAKALGGEPGVRYLIEVGIDVDVITEALGIAKDEYDAVVAKIAAERAEHERVVGLLEKVADQSDAEKVKHLITNDVAEALIIEIAGVDQSAIDAANKLMEAEIAEKKRLAEEEAARKAAEAAGPSLDSIDDDDMLEYIEGIKEIMEFSDVEAEIRQMCEQSNYPQCLVDIAVSEPDKLDELETKAGG